jgi:hypothetical protein
MPLPVTIQVLSAKGDAIRAKIDAAVKRAMTEAAPNVTTLLIDRLSQEADRSLGASAQEYKRGIQDPQAIEITEHSVTLRPITPAAQALEAGYQAYDIKARVLAKARRFDRNGDPYVDVPFSHKTEGTGAMPGEVKASLDRELRNVQARLRHAGQSTAGAVARHRAHTPGQSFTRTLHGPNGQPAAQLAVQHKRGIHDDMIRRRLRERSRSSEYSTFRRISANSDPLSWWHPGFHGVKLFSKVRAQVKEQIERIFADALTAQGLTVKR